MSRTICEHCGTQADTKAGKCPGCGNPLRSSMSGTAKAVIAIVAVLLIAGGAIMVVMEDDPETPSNGTTVVEPVPTLPEKEGD
ncbi:hypothetical protein SAMN05216203_2985 [Marinobacter daqiaonensis]|uniref:Zinc-ribbon domain-containing protein n=1 Tax=Marinobacter daqiaonensis TaxID=650891 RepID=A0A1I6JFZ9_9GAMM|nr:hypothetical protein [Marinobacter daqiaonensis]SFR77891.1 hypothetical protein SAMN05216203_2985 [Marinobacter daqiaonensis]